ncbi:uncharacterized protein LOC127079542 [Lathyrus oleraceus]|uniref:uncharacterized protein LOC127079542 n=1 Tax=Pisum sativum TaxID=3888 RepID=UPI0021D06774|nr:uncharacterized protein LOC127079542 [Pisum sativum]
MMSTQWLSKRRMKVKDIKDKALRKWNVGVNKTKAIRARLATRDKVDGSFLGDYIRIYDYCHELLRANPGSVVKLNVEPVQECGLLPAMDDLLPNAEQRFCVRAKPLITMLEEIKIFIVERLTNNRIRFQNVSDNEIFPNIRRKIDRTSTFTNLWLVRRWDLIGLSCIHALSTMKSRNFKIDDYIPEYYMKSRYMEVYKHMSYHVNGSNLWVKTPFPDVQPPKYRKMSGRPKKRGNIEQGEIDGTGIKMRRTSFIVKCSM